MTFLADQIVGDVYDNWHVRRKDSQLHPFKGCTSGDKRWSRWKGGAKTETKRKFWEWWHYFPVYLQAGTKIYAEVFLLFQ
jgi:hypothetical protein